MIRPLKFTKKAVQRVQSIIWRGHMYKYLDNYVPQEKKTLCKNIYEIWLPTQKILINPDAFQKRYETLNLFWVYEMSEIEKDEETNGIVACAGIRRSEENKDIGWFENLSVLK